MEYRFTKIKSMKLAGYLMMNGFVLLRTEQPSYKSRKIFIFHQTDSINQVIENYNSNKQNILDTVIVA